jgi:PKD domain/Secretion system C-terminal sorting domain
VAWYRYEQDTLDPLSVAFTDLSYYEPAEWSWDFGDGSLLSRDTSPAHVFPDKGAYKVCLTVRNQYGTHTHCKTLYLGVSAQDNPVLQAQVQVSPNPFSERLAVALSAPELRGAAFRLFDATGRLVRAERVEYGLNEIDVSDLGKGMYFWAVEKKGERVKSGKSVKI